MYRRILNLMSKITLDKLAIMIQSEFSMVHKELSSLKEGQVSLERGQIALEKGQASLERGQATIRENLDSLDIKVSANSTVWQQDFDKLDGRVFQNEVDIAALNKIVLKKKS